MGKLDGKVAIITGSTSGMGRDTAYLFAKEGAKVVVTGRNEARAKAVVDKIKAEGGEAMYVIADTSDLEAPQKIFDATMAAYGTVDVMKAKGEGHIINTSSVAGCAAHWGPVAYCTSKHAMNGLTKSMALELGPEIHVNGIQPGAILTAMLDEAGGEAAMGFMKDRSPLHRVAQGSEIATVALFLATKDSSFIDGQLIRVDGGVDI